MVHAGESELTPRLARQLAGRCCYGACPALALEASDYCGPHDAHEKGRDRAKKKRRRQTLADKGLCRDGCGRKVGKRKVRGRVVQRRCSTCLKRFAAWRRRVPDENCRVPGAEQISPVKLEVGKDGATRTRYVPRPGQGGQSREETRKGRRKLVSDAARLVGVFLANYEAATMGLLDAMPRIQRAEAKRQLVDPLARAARLLELVHDEEMGVRTRPEEE
jgi:hypothetical protein